MEHGLQFSTCSFCTGVLDLVVYGHISARKGVSLLISFRKMGTPEERKCTTAALRHLTNSTDKGLARSSRIALYDLYMEDLWDLFTHNIEAVARVKAEYDEVSTGCSSPHPPPPSTSTPAFVAGTPVNCRFQYRLSSPGRMDGGAGESSS